ELALADVDADVVHAATAAEEHQVAGGHVGAVGDLLAAAGLVARDARQVDAQGGAIDVADQATAVEAPVRRTATPAIRRAEQGERTAQHGLHGSVAPGRFG